MALATKKSSAEADSVRGRNPFLHAGAADGGSVFSGAVTLDPDAVLDAWTRLAQDARGWTFRSLPAILHYALIETLVKRKDLSA